MAKSAITTLKENATKINKELDKAGKSNFVIGKILKESREYFSSTDDFLSWAKNGTGLGKAQVYNLMKQYTVFGEDETWSKVASRVLSLLAGKNDEIVAKCKEYIVAGNTLDTKAYNEIVDSVERPATNNNNNTGENNGTIGSTNNSNDNVGNSGDTKPTGNSNDISGKPTEEKESEEEKLNKKILELEEQLANTRKNLEKVLDSQKLAILPQFKSYCMYARLGISIEESQDKKAVQKAYRELAKLYTASKYPEVATALVEARDALTK